MIDLPLPRELPLDLQIAGIIHVIKQIFLPLSILVIEVLPSPLVLKLFLLFFHDISCPHVGQVLLLCPHVGLDRLIHLSFLPLPLDFPILCLLLHVHQCLLLFFERDECPVLLVQVLLFPLVPLVLFLSFFKSLLEMVTVLLVQLETELMSNRAHKLEVSLLLLEAQSGLRGLLQVEALLVEEFVDDMLLSSVVLRLLCDEFVLGRR
jgi:hypothetical protein